MNDTLAILLLGFIQGLTEFLPISSSMHLVLLDQYVWAHDPSLDVAVHLGSLLAVMLVFWRKVKQLLNGLHDLGRRRITPAVKLLLLLILATLPVIIAGLALDRFGREYLHHPTIIGATSLGFGVRLCGAERCRQGHRRLKDWSIGSALTMGFAQILALVPGASRSGVTMTAALSLGYSAPEAARIALLMSMPVIAGAATLGGYQVLNSGNFTLSTSIGLAVLASFVASMLAIPAMIWVLERIGYLPFIIYRCALGVYLLTL